MRALAGRLFLIAILAAACTDARGPAADRPSPTPTAGSPSPRPSPAVAFDPDRALATIRLLADGNGPREATTAAYRRAAAHVETTLRALGYAVRRLRVSLPAGRSGGVEVPAGAADDVIAEPPDFRPSAPYRIVGAHLDTLPRSPGAVDNASGIAVMLELARLATLAPPQIPIVFVAFAAEESRGSRGLYGSGAFVARMDAAARHGLAGMVAIDRPAVGPAVMVCNGGRSSDALQRAFLDRARALGVPASGCRNRSSDHWSFERAGYAAARFIGVDFPEYHTPRDTPAVVDRAQLERVGLVAWETLHTHGPG